MPNLENRIAALEQTIPPDGAPTIFLVFIADAADPQDWQRASDGERVFEREPGESVEAFKRRAGAGNFTPMARLVMLS